MEVTKRTTAERSVSDEFHATFEPLLVRVNSDAAAPRDIRVDKDEFKIGRGRENDEIILDTSISRKHCVLRREGSREWTIVDLSSSCTSINDTPVGPGTRNKLSVGDIIQFSPDERFRYVFTLTLKDERNPKRRRIDNEMQDTIVNEQMLLAEGRQWLRRELRDKLETNAQEQKILKQELQDCLSEEKQKLEEALATCKREKDLLAARTKEEMERWKKQQQKELERLIESVKNAEKGVQERLLSEKSVLEDRLRQTESALRSHEEKVGLSRINDDDNVSTEFLNTICSPAPRILDTIDLTHNARAMHTPLPVAEGVLCRVNNIMDEQLTCSVCSELFIEATTLNCKHTFCRHCINAWNKKRPECPMCRTPVTSKNGALALDNFIAEMIDNLPDTLKLRRKQLVEERRGKESVTRRKRASGRKDKNV